jgi:hypothetical protein
MGAAFIRNLEETSPLFQGKAIWNTWWMMFQDQTAYDPTLSHGQVLISKEDGLPAVLIFGHCDDFFIHGPVYEKC